MSRLIASMDMYCWPENAHVWNKLWHLTREGLKPGGEGRAFDCPEHLTALGEDPFAVWENPNLMLGHTCGRPYVNRLQDKVALVGVFDHGLEQCNPGQYCSIFIGHPDNDESVEELALNTTRRIAVNSFDSQSGWRALTELGIDEDQKDESPERFIITGSHRDSIKAVACGEADLAAIDAASFQLAERFEPTTQKLKVLGTSIPVPALPLITAKSRSLLARNFRAKIRNALHQLSEKERKLICAYDVLAVTPEAYEAL